MRISHFYYRVDIPCVVTRSFHYSEYASLCNPPLYSRWITVIVLSTEYLCAKRAPHARYTFPGRSNTPASVPLPSPAAVTIG